MYNSPSVISSSPAIIRRVVDFPQPEGPTKMINSLSAISRLKFFTATNPLGYVLLMFLNDKLAICFISSLDLRTTMCYVYILHQKRAKHHVAFTQNTVLYFVKIAHKRNAPLHRQISNIFLKLYD